MQNKHHHARGALRRFTSMLLACAILGGVLAGTVYATSKNDLQQNLDDARNEYNAQSNALKDAKNETKDAQKTVNSLNQQSQAIVDEIAVIDGQMDELNLQIAEKEVEIEQRQAEIDARWGDFKHRVSAMQEMRDSGMMTMLSAVKDLYQFLTFNEALQDVSAKDTEVLDDMKQRKEELEQVKKEKEDAVAQLEAAKAELEVKQEALAKSLKNANKELSDAKAAEAAQQIITDEARAKWTKAQEELDAYIKSHLDANGSGGLSFGMNFRAALNSYTRISTYFGVKDAWHNNPHGGTDYAAPKGTPIYACESGKVIIATYSSSYGYYVTINHGEGTDGNTYATLYAHMKNFVVSAGQKVNRGDLIGYVGSTGRSTGPHLHLELWRNGGKINSRDYIPDR
ncbi:MAG: peptidoglycan DD-metalloendopeptidase family protein [Faecalibacterium sp.]|nr:peptidoglycan DD-metalloendopeptidase family protein [Faecalibacterium sp.]